MSQVQLGLVVVSQAAWAPQCKQPSWCKSQVIFKCSACQPCKLCKHQAQLGCWIIKIISHIHLALHKRQQINKMIIGSTTRLQIHTHNQTSRCFPQWFWSRSIQRSNDLPCLIPWWIWPSSTQDKQSYLSQEWCHKAKAVRGSTNEPINLH